MIIPGSRFGAFYRGKLPVTKQPFRKPGNRESQEVIMEQKEQKGQPGVNWLALGLKVFAAIVVFNIIAALVFYFFISPHMVKPH